MSNISLKFVRHGDTKVCHRVIMWNRPWSSIITKILTYCFLKHFIRPGCDVRRHHWCLPHFWSGKINWRQWNSRNGHTFLCFMAYCPRPWIVVFAKHDAIREDCEWPAHFTRSFAVLVVLPYSFRELLVVGKALCYTAAFFCFNSWCLR